MKRTNLRRTASGSSPRSLRDSTALNRRSTASSKHTPYAAAVTPESAPTDRRQPIWPAMTAVLLLVIGFTYSDDAVDPVLTVMMLAASMLLAFSMMVKADMPK